MQYSYTADNLRSDIGCQLDLIAYYFENPDSIHGDVAEFLKTNTLRRIERIREMLKEDLDDAIESEKNR